MISTGGLPLTNSLLVVPDDKMPDEEEKTKLVRDVQGPNSHGLVSLQFLGAPGIFLGLIFLYHKMLSQNFIRTFHMKL